MALDLLAFVGIFLILLALAGGFLWWRANQPDLRDGYRLWGVSPPTGTPSTSAAACQQTCLNTPGATGFAQWKTGNRCWCVSPPYLAPKWTQDQQWDSGTFKRGF